MKTTPFDRDELKALLDLTTCLLTSPSDETLQTEFLKRTRQFNLKHGDPTQANHS